MLTFLCGFGGSVAVELVALLRVYEREPILLPPRYKRLDYYVVRGCLAIVAGLFAVAYGVYDRPILAVNIGASAPLIFQALASGIQSTPTLRRRLGAHGRSQDPQ